MDDKPRENDLPSEQHVQVRSFLRIAGPLTVAVGAIMIMIGVGSFFASFGSFQPPRYFWCAFAGMPLAAAGVAMTKFGYLGAIQRYVASESAPVAKDVVNYLGDGVQPGLKAMAKAVSEGIAEGQQERRQ
jgi:hypothetical protein